MNAAGRAPFRPRETRLHEIRRKARASDNARKPLPAPFRHMKLKRL